MTALSGPILITGAAGFVGANLCRYFSARGHRVIAFTSNPIRSGEPLPWRLRPLDREKLSFETRSLDLRDRESIRRTFTDLKPSAVINCAAYGAYSSQTDRERIYEVNFSAVRWMLEAASEAPGFSAFLQAGSSSEYGLNCSGPSEEAPPSPDSDYAVSKLAATAATQFFAIKHGVPAWVLRLYSVYGPFEDASRLIPKLLLAAAEGHLPPLVDPAISRDFIHIDDVCRAFDAVLNQKVEGTTIFNIGSGQKTTLGNLVEVARTTFGVSETPKWGSMEKRHWDHPEWFANPAKAAKLLGWNAKVPLQEGLKRTAEWMKAHPEAMRAAETNAVTKK